jgi:hypothetical protein
VTPPHNASATTVQPPDLRATLRHSLVRVIDWTPSLVTDGPLWTLLEQRGRAGVAIADIALVRDDDGHADEAIVSFLTGDTPQARTLLRDWAVDVGYRRLWMPAELVELPGPAQRVAEARCTGCGAELVDGGAHLWQLVRLRGRFPNACPLCGSDLPQWRARHDTPTSGKSDPVEVRRCT